VQQLRDIKLFPGQIVIMFCNSGCRQISNSVIDSLSLKKSDTVGKFIKIQAEHIQSFANERWDSFWDSFTVDEWCIYKGKVPNIQLKMDDVDSGEKHWGLWELPLKYNSDTNEQKNNVDQINDKNNIDYTMNKNPNIIKPNNVISKRWRPSEETDYKTSLEKVIEEIRRIENDPKVKFILLSSSCRSIACGVPTDYLKNSGRINGGQKRQKKVRKFKKKKVRKFKKKKKKKSKKN
ncbi:uncharacterized protein METZ01_LOCUS495546, partial [marine metagenome]